MRRSFGRVVRQYSPLNMVANARPKLVVVYDRESLAPFEIAEAARNLCDLIWVFDFTDPVLSQLLPLIRRLGTAVDTAGLNDEEIAALVGLDRPDGVITFSSEVIPLAAAIAEESDLRFHSRRTADVLANKSRQRAALAHAGVPGPRFWPAPSGTDLTVRAHLVADVSYPVVLKPERGSGSRDTYQVPDAATLLRLLHEAQCRAEDMLVEEVLGEAHPRDAQRFGDVLMVDSVAFQGRVTNFVVAGHFIPAPPFRGTGSFVPSGLGDAETRAVFEATEAALEALGVDKGFTNTDLILTPDGPRVLEVNGRIGGQIPTLLRLAGTRRLLPEAMRFALRESDGQVAPLQSEHVAFCVMYQPPMEAQRLVELSGLDAVAQLPGVSQVIPDRRVGDAIDWRRGTMTRLLTVYGVASDHGHLYELYQQIQQSIVARYEMDETVQS